MREHAIENARGLFSFSSFFYFEGQVRGAGAKTAGTVDGRSQGRQITSTYKCT